VTRGRDAAIILPDSPERRVSPQRFRAAAGANIDPQKRASIIAKLHQYTGLPAACIGKANLRVTAGEFEKTLQDDHSMTTGRYDTRFTGPTMDPLSKDSEYDPQEAAIGSAFVSAFNDYVRKDLKLGADRAFKPEIRPFRTWNFSHVQPDETFALQRNIEFKFYESEPMVYAHEPSLKALHDNVADFIRRTENLAAPQ
jgi:hypothetical protein